MMETIVAHAANKKRCSREQADDFDAYPAAPDGSLLLNSDPTSLAPPQRCRASAIGSQRRPSRGRAATSETLTERGPLPRGRGAGALRTLRVIRLRRRDQQGSTHTPTGRSASSTGAFPLEVDRFLRSCNLLAISALERQARRALDGYISSQDSEKDSTCGTQQASREDGR